MKILVMSDSHGNSANMLRAVEKTSPGLIIHLGDCVQDTAVLRRNYPHIPLYIIRGNCDIAPNEEEYRIEEVDGVRIFFAHGHRHNVKINMDAFCNSVYFSGSRLGLYGHTHRARWQRLGEMELLNPGSIGDAYHPSYAVVETADGNFSCHIYDLEEDI